MSIAKKYYKELGLPFGADELKIKKAYRRLAKRVHPDVNPNPNAAHQFAKLNQAYNFLLLFKQGKARDRVTSIPRPTPPPRKKQFYGETKFTEEEMEAAWERARERAEQEFEDYKHSWQHKFDLAIGQMLKWAAVALGILFGLIYLGIALTAVVAGSPLMFLIITAFLGYPLLKMFIIIFSKGDTKKRKK